MARKRQVALEDGAETSSTAPVIPYQPNSRKPVIGRPPREESEWQFSFKYWRQIPYFEIGQLKDNWYVGLINRLAELSSQQFGRFFDGSGYGVGAPYRIHAIKWEQKNCPIKRKDLNWLNKDILDNPEEFELYQVAVSTSFGRIIGYKDKEIFYIVLLDPFHNLQPVMSLGYRIDKTFPGACQLTGTLEINKRVSASLRGMGADCCKLADELDQGESNVLTPNALVHYVDDAQRADIEKCAQDHDLSLVELMEYGILAVNEGSKESTPS